MRRNRTRVAVALVGGLILAFAFGALILPAIVTGRWAKRVPAPPPDLAGNWIQVGWENADSYYDTATITDETITIYRCPTDGSAKVLYWYGTFTPPEDGKEPYNWESENLTLSFMPRTGSIPGLEAKISYYTLVDETKTFIYKKNQLIYNLYDGHLKIGIAMERVEPEESGTAGEVL